MSKAIIFDRDGVLTYFDAVAATTYFEPLVPVSVFELAGRWQLWGEQVGFPATLIEEEEFFHSFWDHVGATYDLSTETVDRLRTVDYLDFIVAYPEAVDVVSKIRQRGYAVGVLSNFTMASLDASLARVGLSQYVDSACAATVIGASKPDEAAYAAIVAQLGADPEQSLFFDDEAECVAGGLSFGLQAFLVDRTRTSPDYPGKVIHRLTDIPPLLE